MNLTKNVSLVDVLEHGFEVAKDNNAQGFEYEVGKIRGGTITVSFTPDDKSCYDTVSIDTFNYTLISE